MVLRGCGVGVKLACGRGVDKAAGWAYISCMGWWSGTYAKGLGQGEIGGVVSERLQFLDAWAVAGITRDGSIIWIGAWPTVQEARRQGVLAGYPPESQWLRRVVVSGSVGEWGASAFKRASVALA